MNGFRFHDPEWFWLLIPLVILGWLTVRRRAPAVLYSSAAILKQLPRSRMLRWRRQLPWLRLCGLALMVAALARPQVPDEDSRLRSEGAAVELCIDHTQSMHAYDMSWEGKRVPRLTALKALLRRFVEGDETQPGRPNDLIGLVDFGGFAEVRCPATLDHNALLAAVEAVAADGNVAGVPNRAADNDKSPEGSRAALGDAVAVAVDRLKSLRAKNKFIILISDSQNVAGAVEPNEAANAARTFGVKIYTIGISGVTSVSGRGSPGPGEDVDERTLTMLAENTGGVYFSARTTDVLQAAISNIGRLETPLSDANRYGEYWELYEYALSPGLTLLLAQLALVCTMFRSLP